MHVLFVVVCVCVCVFQQVQSHLENSKFHLHQGQNQPVKQYLTLGSKLASSTGSGHTVPHPHAPGQPLATVPIMRNGHMPAVSDGSSPNSPVTLLTMGNHEGEVRRKQKQKNYVEYMELKLCLKVKPEQKENVGLHAGRQQGHNF